MNNYNTRDSGGKRDFKKGDRGGDRNSKPDFKKRSFGADRGSDREVTFHKATCADCNKVCEVPFRPNGEKPVFCRDCFGAKKGADERGGDRSTRPQFESRAPAHIWSDRNPGVPAYAKVDTKPQVSEEMKRQISDILYKLDKLTGLVEKMSEVKSPIIKTEVSKVVESGEPSLGEEAPKKKVATKKKVTKKAE